MFDDEDDETTLDDVRSQIDTLCEEIAKIDDKLKEITQSVTDEAEETRTVIKTGILTVLFIGVVLVPFLDHIVFPFVNRLLGISY
jgi:hypothetical protein